MHADQITQRVGDMHAHDRRVGLQIPVHQRQMHVAVHVILVAVEPELAVGGAHGLLGDALDRALGLQAVADQVGDGADLELVLACECFELGPARHGAVVVHDLDDRGRGLETGQARQVTARLGVSGPREHATGLRHDREYVPGLA